MELNEYQDKAMTTCLPTSDNFAYMILNLIGEVGEFSEKALKAQMPFELRERLKKVVDIAQECGAMAKTIRKTEGHSLQSYNLKDKLSEMERLLLFKEAGDIAWQLAGICKVMEWSLQSVCNCNLYKLADRKERHVIDGNGDER